MIKINSIWVGQGDCTLIETNAGHNSGELILIDCGTSDSMSIFEENVQPTIENILKSYPTTKTKIDYMFLTHSDKDHVNLVKNLLVLSTVSEVTNLYYGGLLSPYLRYIGIKVGGKWQLDPKIKKVNNIANYFFNTLAATIIGTPDFKLWILSGNYPFKHEPPVAIFDKDVNEAANRKSKPLRSAYDINGNSLIILINYKGFQAMFMGDATYFQQQMLLEELKKAGKEGDSNSISFKMSHHGSPDSFNKEFTNTAVKPNVITSSSGITFGHPSLQAIDEITSIKSGAPMHQITLFDESTNQYEYYTTDNWVYNTMLMFSESSEFVPTKTKSGKRSRDSHAGEAYTALKGINWTLEVDDTGTTYKPKTMGATAIILTTKDTINPTSKKSKKGSKT